MIRWCEQPRIINTISYYHAFSIAYSLREAKTLQAADKGFSYTLLISFRSKEFPDRWSFFRQPRRLDFVRHTFTFASGDTNFVVGKQFDICVNIRVHLFPLSAIQWNSASVVILIFILFGCDDAWRLKHAKVSDNVRVIVLSRWLERVHSRENKFNCERVTVNSRGSLIR